MAEYKVVFATLETSVTVEAGTTLLEAAGRARITIDSVCGGDGICGRCKMIVKEGEVGGDVTALLTRDQIRQGIVLACQTTVQSDLVVNWDQRTHVDSGYSPGYLVLEDADGEADTGELPLPAALDEGNLEGALNERKRPGGTKKLNLKGEAVLETLAHSTPPEGRKRWTLHLLADRLVELKVVDSISHETVRREVKKKGLGLE